MTPDKLEKRTSSIPINITETFLSEPIAKSRLNKIVYKISLQLF